MTKGELLGSAAFASEPSSSSKGSKNRRYNRPTRRHAKAVGKEPKDVVGKATERQDTPGPDLSPFDDVPAPDPGDGPSIRGPPIFIALPAVMARTGLAKSTIYMLIERGTFPAPVRATPRRVFWIQAEVEAFQRARIAERDSSNMEAA